MIIERLPDKYPFRDYVRIGRYIYRVLARLGKWHLLIKVYDSFGK